MIIWEIRDAKGYLITKEFSERKAIIKKMRLENRGSGVLHISKVFQAEERKVDPIKKFDEEKRHTYEI
jgi:hypothetical protein